MPGFGERIGDAYVRVHASGEHLGDDLVAGFKDAESELGKAGEEGGDKYNQGVRKSLKKGERFNAKEARDAMVGTLREMRLVGQQSGGEYFAGLRRTLTKELGDSNLGGQIATTIEKQFRASGGRFSFVDDLLADTSKMTRVFDDASDHMRRLEVDARRMNIEFDEMRRAVNDADRVFKRSEGIVEFNRRADHLGTTIGRVFGRGSRSEFLNFFGRLAGGFVSVLALPFRLGAGMFELGRSMQFAFSNAAEGASLFTKLGAGFAQMGLTLPVLLASLTALAVGLGAVFIVIGPLISALSLLAGIATALAASIGFALVAAVGSLAAVMVPAVAGLAVLVAGLASMDAKSKRMLKESVKPLVAEFKELGSVARSGLLSRIGPTIDNVAKAFSGLKPLVKEVSIAIADVGFGFSKALNSPGFRAFRDEMATFLPGAVRKLGEAFRHTLGGIGGLFRGMIPFMDRVLDGLVKITRQFSEWANSPKGQNQIDDFFKKAETSARSFGGFLKELVGLIGDLFSAGRGTGDDLFTSMKNSIADFRKFLKSDPDILKDWFDSAKRFGKQLGNLVVEIGRVLDALDNARTRNEITSVVETLTKGMRGLAKVIDVTNTSIDTFQGNIESGPTTPGWLSTLSNIFEFLSIDITDTTELTQAFLEIFGKEPPKNSLDNLRDVIVGLGTDFQDTGRLYTEMLGLLGIEPPNQDALADAPKKAIAAYRALIDAIIQYSGLRLFSEDKSSKERLADLKNFVTAYQQAGALPTLTPKVNPKGIKELMTLTGATARDLIKVGAIPPIRPKANPSEIKALKTATGLSYTELAKLGSFKNIKPTADASRIENLKRITGLSRGELVKLGLVKAKPKIDVQSNAEKAAAAARKAISSVKSKKVYIDTIYRTQRNRAANPTIQATGGIMDTLSGDVFKVHKMMAGGIATFRQFISDNVIAGESGREAIVPLDRPLGQVDPAVRALAAFAQNGGLGGTSTTNNRGGIDVGGITIVTPTSDPRAVARETISELALTGGYS